jgi:hypothetical protein
MLLKFSFADIQISRILPTSGVQEEERKKENFKKWEKTIFSKKSIDSV